jgi:Calcineurin-like phosphoesterase superfamily domain
MCIAVLTGVHKNRFALEAVLYEISSFKPNVILNLGDTVLGGADPVGAWRLHLESGALTVRGNANEEVSNPEPDLDPERLGFVNWLRTMFNQDDFQTMQNMPTMLKTAWDF